MRKQTFTIALGLIVLIAGSLTAEPVRNAVEKSQDRKGIAQAQNSVADDRFDLMRLTNLVTEWDALRRADGNALGMQELESRIEREIKRDIAELEFQVAQAGKEVRQSSAEVHSDNREVHREGTADSRHDRRDDRRDRRDDVRDKAKLQEILGDKREIASNLQQLQQKIDAGSKPRAAAEKDQSKLLFKYLDISKQEIELGLREIAEDRRELGEDRRETREDRRQRW